MLDIKFIKENREIVEMAIKNKKTKGEIDLDLLFSLHSQKSELRTKLDEVNAQRNQAAKEQNIEKGKQLKEEASELESKLSAIDKQFLQIMLLIPNIPSADTPIGPDESGNKVVRHWGEIPKFNFEPKAHWDLGEELGIIDNERAAKVSGSRFTFLKGDIVRLQYALMQFGMEILTNEDTLKTIAEEAGLEVSTKPFVPVWPPDMVRPAVYNRLGRLDPKEDKYYLGDEDDVYLAGSAEHTLGAIHMDEILDEKEMPVRYVAYSTCFRREAGAAGKDTRGILRMHQFDKMEMETFCLPEKSREEQDFLVAIQEYVMRKLKLPYQVVAICTGDMGIPDHRQIDIDAWMPGQDAYKETHTSDLMTSFQSRRLNTRVKREGGNEFVHMNDATLFSMRPLIAIMENYQEKDGSIKIPEVLQKYVGKDRIIKISL
ncbi:serine--tRNA ligase [Candidatus Nomurabacteria bacterium]|nr:serine--tRNA ligase [Candidatus Nomurabacteria bacterium]